MSTGLQCLTKYAVPLCLVIKAHSTRTSILAKSTLGVAYPPKSLHFSELHPLFQHYNGASLNPKFSPFVLPSLLNQSCLLLNQNWPYLLLMPSSYLLVVVVCSLEGPAINIKKTQLFTRCSIMLLSPKMQARFWPCNKLAFTI